VSWVANGLREIPVLCLSNNFLRLQGDNSWRTSKISLGDHLVFLAMPEAQDIIC